VCGGAIGKMRKVCLKSSNDSTTNCHVDTKGVIEMSLLGTSIRLFAWMAPGRTEIWYSILL